MKTLTSYAVLTALFAALTAGVSPPVAAGPRDSTVARLNDAGPAQSAERTALQYPDPQSTELFRDRITEIRGEAVRRSQRLQSEKYELRRAVEKSRTAERRFNTAMMNARRAAELARQTQQRARSLSVRARGERRAQGNGLESLARQATATARHAWWDAHTLAKTTERLRIQLRLARREAVHAAQSAARALQAARYASRWRRMVANTYFTPEQNRALAAMSRQ